MNEKNLLPKTVSEKWIYASPSRGEGARHDNQLVLSGAALSFGAFRCDVPAPKGWVQFSVFCRTENLVSPETAVTAMLSFSAADGSVLRRQYADV